MRRKEISIEANTSTAARAAVRTAAFVAVTLAAAAPASTGLPSAIHQTLPSGMELVLIEDHSTPLVSVCLRVEVGSVDETGRTSGASHLLEHLLFDGTRLRTREQIQAEFDRNGIYVNAFTREEYTAHILSAPREAAELAIEIQADMLLDSTFPEAEVAKERNVVLEEMKRDRDNPAGYGAEMFGRELWKGSPLAHPVLGTESSVTLVSRDEIMAFWRRHYLPDRMIALVIGDFDPAAMRPLFDRLYGGAVPALVSPDDNAATGMAPSIPARREREEWVSGAGTTVRFGFTAPPWNHQLAPAMEVTARLLLDGSDSRLVKRLSGGDAPLATGIEGGTSFYGRGSAFTITAGVDDVARVPGVEAALAVEFDRLASKGPEPEELERVKTAYRVADAFESDNLLYFAMGLADWFARGGYEGRERFSRQVMAVDAAAVRAIARDYLVPMRAVVHITRPLPQEGDAALAPGAGARTQRRQLPNGLVIIGRENPASRIAAFHALVGHRLELEPAGKAGLANLTLEMLAEGTRSKDTAEIARELAAMGARLQVAEDPRIPFDDYYWSPDYAFVRLEVPGEFASRAVLLFDELLRHPAFPAGRIDPARERVLAAVTAEEASAGTLGRHLLREGLFAGSPWANPIRGTGSSLGTVSREDLVAFHRAAFTPANIIISFAGGAPLEATFAAIERDWSDAPSQDVPPITSPVAAPVVSASLKKPLERDQMWIGLARRAPGATAADMPAMLLAVAVLDRRLGLELREKQGLAYSVGAGAGLARDFGWVSLTMGTRTENRSRALSGLHDAIQTMRSGGVTPDELELARNATLAQRFRYRQRAIGQAYVLGLNEYLGLGYDFDSQEAARFQAVAIADVARAAERTFAPDGWVTAEVGRVTP